MRGLADGRVVHVQVIADGPHDHPELKADANVHRDPMAATDLLAVAADRLLHGQGGIGSAYRMVLMRQRRKQGHDTITHDLVDGAFIAMHRLHHAFQHRVEELPGFFRIAVGQQLHGTSQVREQHGDVFAFAFERTTGGQNLLGQVLRCIGQGGAFLLSQERSSECWHARGWGRRWWGRVLTQPRQHAIVLVHARCLA